MITLTTPKSVNNVLGSATTVSYDKVVITSLSYDIVAKLISGAIKLVSSTIGSQTPIIGTVTISVSSATATVLFPTLAFSSTVALSGPQTTSVQGWFDTVQAQVEGGLVSVGIIAGTQSTGT